MTLEFDGDYSKVLNERIIIGYSCAEWKGPAANTDKNVTIIVWEMTKVFVLIGFLLCFVYSSFNADGPNVALTDDESQSNVISVLVSSGPKSFVF